MKHFLTLVIASFLMSACSFFDINEPATPTPTDAQVVRVQEDSENNPDHIKSREEVMEAIKRERENVETLNTVSLSFQKKESSEKNQVEVNVWIVNEKEQELSSVQAWVSYSTSALKGLSLEIPKSSLLTLSAPGENTFDAQAGIAKIGISLEGGNTINEKEILIATLVFEKLPEGGLASLEFFNVGDDGNTRVIALTDNGPRNVLVLEGNAPFVVE